EGEGVAVQILRNLNIDLMELRKTVEQYIKSPSRKLPPSGNIPLVKQAEKALKITYLEAKLFKSNIIGTEHLLLSILKDEDNAATRAMHKFNIDYDTVKDELELMLKEKDPHADLPGNTADDDDDAEGF